MKTGELVLGPAVDGVRRGTLTVTITYLRGARPDHVALTFYPPDGLQRDGSAWPLVRTNGTVSFTVDLPAPKQGGSRTYTFAFRRAVTVTGGNFSVELRGVTKQKDVLSESNPYNNEITVPIRTVD